MSGDTEHLRDVIEKTEIRHLLGSHPYDLSGGEQQRAALAKVLLLDPEIILLDEPTKGLDGFYKKKLAQILKGLTAEGKTILMVPTISNSAQNTGIPVHYSSTEVW